MIEGRGDTDTLALVFLEADLKAEGEPSILPSPLLVITFVGEGSPVALTACVTEIEMRGLREREEDTQLEGEWLGEPEGMREAVM